MAIRIDYTIANGMNDICTDIILDRMDAIHRARQEHVRAYEIYWDGQDAQSISAVNDITDERE